MAAKDFVSLCRERYFNNTTTTNGGMMINMQYLDAVSKGEIRVVMVKNKPVSVVHKQPKSHEDGTYFSCTSLSGATHV